ncbi:hypothetical protein WDW89_11500 [Deltaproteobacteria bacterium TL4]
MLLKEKIESEFHHTLSFEVGGRSWKLLLTPSSSYLASHQHLQFWMVLAGGLLCSLLTMLYFSKSFRHTMKLEKEIHERQQAENELQQYKEHLEDQVEKRTHDLDERMKELNSLYGDLKKAKEEAESF